MSSSSFPYGVFRAVAAGGSVSLPGENTYFFSAGGTVHAGYAFQDDGQIERIGPALATRVQIDPGSWWSLEPVVAIGAGYDIRCASVLGAWDVQAASVGTWIQLNAERVWRNVVIAMASPTSASSTGTFEIRPFGGGATLASGVYYAECEN